MSSDSKVLAVLGLLFAAVAGLVAFSVTGGKETSSPAAPDGDPAAPPPGPSVSPASADAPATPIAPVGPSPSVSSRAPAPRPADDGWAGCPLALPDGACRVTFQRKPAPEASGKLLRRVRIETPGEGQDVLLPRTADATGYVNVYWYPMEEKRGPFVRIQDADGEYLLTFRSKTIARMLRIKGETYVGVLVAGESDFGWTEGPDGRVIVTIAGRNAIRLPGRLAESPGHYLGRVEAGEDGPRFVTAADAAEAPFSKTE